MSNLHTDLFAIVNRFPEREEMLKKLFAKSENFKVVCEDYRKCSEALHYWDRSDSEESSERRADYSALLQELEAEIFQCLTKSNIAKCN